VDIGAGSCLPTRIGPLSAGTGVAECARVVAACTPVVAAGKPSRLVAVATGIATRHTRRLSWDPPVRDIAWPELAPAPRAYLREINRMSLLGKGRTALAQ
jgi:hypothetical protein